MAALFLHAVINVSSTYRSNYPAAAYSSAAAFWMEAVLTLGLVSVILGTASGAQNVGLFGALGVGGYIAVAHRAPYLPKLTTPETRDAQIAPATRLRQTGVRAAAQRVLLRRHTRRRSAAVAFDYAGHEGEAGAPASTAAETTPDS
jgi:hypothetical protein